MNIGLVLSGGMAKGAYQIGVLRALNYFIPREEIKYISCASVGVLNGYAYAADNLDLAEQMWKNACNDDARYFISQILRSSMLQQDIKNIYASHKEISSPFYCALFDVSHRNIVYKDLSAVDQALIPQYLKASVAMPIYNHSVRIKNTSYYDGAMIDNIPVYPLLKHNLDLVICVCFDDTCYKFENTYFDNKIIKIIFPGENILRQSTVFKRENIERMIQEGYDKTMRILQTVFSEGYENLEAVYRAIDCMNQNKSSSLRITGDVLVTNLNKITQRLTKRKIL